MNKNILQIIGALIIGFLIGYVIANNAGNAKITELEDQKSSVVVENRQLTEKAKDVDALKAELSRLNLNSASGGGVNSKMMPHPDTGELSVELQEVFSFDNNHAFCRVDNNPEAFIMPTFQMGEVLIEENEFFMAMSTTTIEEFKVTKGTDGHNEILITGGLDCFTEVAKANLTMGSREVAEFAEY